MIRITYEVDCKDEETALGIEKYQFPSLDSLHTTAGVLSWRVTWAALPDKEAGSGF